MAVKLTKPEMINQQVGWCGGCGHGIIQRLIAECCEELGIVEKTEGSTVYTVEGNSSDAVNKRSYDINNGTIMGYGIL